MLWKAERLVAFGFVGIWSYVMLLVLGFSSAAFLFGVLHSFAAYKGRQLGGRLELSGPIIGVVAVILGGIYLPIRPPEAFSLTVFLQGEKGSTDVILKDEGYVSIVLGTERRRQKVDGNGMVEFKNVPATFRGQTVPLRVEANGFEPVDTTDERKLLGQSIHIALRRKPDVVSGRVQDTDGNPITNAIVRIGEVKSVVSENGLFKIALSNAPVTSSIDGSVTAPGFENWRGKFTLNSSEAAVMLRRK
jgi:hypothetical protein